jgi:hypothetical protein
MTVNAVRRSRRRAASSSPESSPAADTLAIGEIDQTVFDCPKCSRPLAVGARRCPGCRTRLLLGVPLTKVSLLVSGGLAIGLLVGGVGGAVFGLTRPVPAQAAPIVEPSALPAGGGSGAGASTLPGASALPGSGGGGGGSTGGMPSISSSALVQAVTVNQRLRSASGLLSASLAASKFDAQGVAQTLRTISADTVYGRQLADKVASWSGSAVLGTDLGTLYDSIHDTAAEALTVSVTDPTSYRQAAKAMVRLLASLSAMETQMEELAVSNGVGLPMPSAPPAS